MSIIKKKSEPIVEKLEILETEADVNISSVTNEVLNRLSNPSEGFHNNYADIELELQDKGFQFEVEKGIFKFEPARVLVRFFNANTK